jgi:hypothetical protein
MKRPQPFVWLRSGLVAVAMPGLDRGIHQNEAVILGWIAASCSAQTRLTLLSGNDGEGSRCETR